MTNVRNIRHVARSLALYQARRAGWLEGRTLKDIADALDVHPSTVMRNLRDLDAVHDLAEEYITALSPHVPTKKTMGLD